MICTSPALGKKERDNMALNGKLTDRVGWQSQRSSWLHNQQTHMHHPREQPQRAPEQGSKVWLAMVNSVHPSKEGPGSHRTTGESNWLVSTSSDGLGNDEKSDIEMNNTF